MADALAKPMTLESFLAWEERQELRYEFDGFRPIAMTGGTYAHARIQVSLLRILDNRLDGNPCKAVGSEMKLQTAISHSLPRRLRGWLGHSARGHARARPRRHLRDFEPEHGQSRSRREEGRIPSPSSVQSYVVLQQTRRSAQAFRRVGETTSDDDRTGKWTFEFIVGPDAAIALPEIAVTIPLAEIYDGILPESEHAALSDTLSG